MNSYGHPDNEALAVLSRYGAEIYRTDESGTVIVTTDSHKKITVDKKASAVKENAPPAVTSQTENKNVTNSSSAVNVSDNKTTVVYRTKTGEKYHRDGCSYLKSKIEITVGEAQAMGLTPCSRCNTPR